MLNIRLLGGRALVDADTGEVRARSARTLALVALLACHAGTAQPRGHLAGLFWPDSTEAQALTNLRRELHQLRHALGDDSSLVVTGSDLAWRDRASCQVDLREFRRQRDRAEASGTASALLAHGRAALASYGGDLLPGLYDDWVLEARDQLARECADLCDRMATAARELGDASTALAAARRRIELRPLEETGHRALIDLQVALGDRAGALASYHHCAALLESELGVAPLPSTRAALDRAGSSRRPRTAPAVATSTLVGRDREAARLAGLLRETGAGRRSALLVRGEPGVGKTRLLAELVQRARRADVRVLTARCYPGAGRPPLGPVVEWLGDPGVRADLAALEPVWRREVDRLLPTTSSSRPDAGPRGVADAWQRHRFFQALARALRGGGRPLLLVLDDVQWCDGETLDLLAFLLAETGAAGLLVALAARDRELSGSARHEAWSRRMRGTGALQAITLQPLGPADTARLAGRLLGRELPDGAARQLHAATGGFPLSVVEAVRAGRPGIGDAHPAFLSEVLRSRLAALTPEAARLSGLAAAIGRGFDLPLLCEAADLPAEQVADAVDELWRQRIVEERSAGYDFSHDLVRAAAYEQVSPPRRWLLHRRVAQALELRHPGHTDEVAAQLAEQYSRAGETQRAVGHLRRAADRATAVFAYDTAIRHNRAALDLLAGMPAGEGHDELRSGALRSNAVALNAVRGYADPELTATLEQLVSLAERTGRRELLVDSLVGLWAARFVQGNNRLAQEIAARALREVRDGPPCRAGLSGQAHFAFGGTWLHLGRPQDALAHFNLAGDRASDEESLSIGSHPAIHARAWSAHAEHALGHTARAAACAQGAVARARRVDHPYSLAIALGYAAVTWQLLDEPERLLAATGELTALSARYGFVYYADWGVVLAGWARGGADGAAQIRRGLAGLRAIGAAARMSYWLTLLADRIPDEERAAALRDAAVVTALAQEDLWWLPEAIRRRERAATPATPFGSPLPARTLAERPGP